MSEAAAQSGISPGIGVASVLSDDRLARRAVNGDERAFAAIFRRYHQSLYRFCLAILGDSQDAQDALQNTMVKVLRALPGEERRIELKPWLYRIAHNESVELIRRRRDSGQLDAELAAPGLSPADEAAVRERLARLVSDMAELPERQREALVMRELAGLDFAEIGAALGTSGAVARQTLYEARLSLRQMDEGREMSCAKVTEALSDGDGRVTRRRDIRAHLRTCGSCRGFGEEIAARKRDFAALSPLPAVAVAGLLHGLLGGHGTGGGGLVGALGGGAAKTVAASTVLKGAATVAVVAAIGVGAADRGGLLDAGLPGGNDSHATRLDQPASGGGAGTSTELGTSPAGKAGVGAAAAGGAHLGASHARGKPAAAGNGKSSAEATAAPTAQPVSTSHPHGKGHAKQPSASAHGQQTAATHKSASHGSSAHHPHPAKPVHPAHPPTSGSSAPPSHSRGNAAQSQPQAAAPGKAASEAPHGEAGKKP